MRTAHKIVEQTNELARQLYALRGYEVESGYRFDLATHPQEQEVWRGACIAQEMLTGTDPEDSLSEIDDEQPTFTCKQCKCEVPQDYVSKTEGYCYLCDPEIE